VRLACACVRVRQHAERRSRGDVVWQTVWYVVRAAAEMDQERAGMHECATWAHAEMCGWRSGRRCGD
jgi:hypothetical protein